jgi:hypothetical protein
MKKNKLTQEQADAIRKVYADPNNKMTMAQIGKNAGVSRQMVSLIVKGKAWTKPEMRGENHPRAKLTKNQVLAIRCRAAHGEAYADLSRAFDVTVANIAAIVERVTWSHLDVEQ